MTGRHSGEMCEQRLVLSSINNDDILVSGTVILRARLRAKSLSAAGHQNLSPSAC